MSEVSVTRFSRCNYCECWKPRTAEFIQRYPPNNLKGDGLMCHCRVCHSLSRKSRRKKYETPEKLRVQRAKWRQRNLERERARDRERYKDSNRKASTLACARRWYEGNKQQWFASNRAYEARKNAAGEHTSADVLQMYEDQGRLCAYCEVQLEGVFHVEHMTPLTRDGSNEWWNLAISCPACNLRKSTRTAVEFMNHSGYPESPYPTEKIPTHN